MNDLSLVSIDNIITELSNRYEHFIFSGMQTGIGGKDKILTTRKWGGNSATCVGLASMLAGVISSDHLSRNELTKPDSYE